MDTEVSVSPLSRLGQAQEAAVSRTTRWLAHGREGSLRWWLYINVVCGIIYARRYAHEFDALEWKGERS